MILHDFTDSLLFQIDRSEDVFVECLVCVISEAVLRAQNNLWTVTGHDARSKKFLLNQISFLASQNIGKKVNLSLCNFLFVNVILLLQREDSQVRILLFFQDNFENAYMTNCHDWRVKFLAKEAAILARHYPLNSRYFKPWFLWLLFNDALFF